MDPATVPQIPSWAEITAEATGQGGDHTVKLTDTAREEFQHYHDPIYVRAAAFRLKLI